MITREEAVRRLEEVEREVEGLKKALLEGWQENAKDPTWAFLKTCEGWEDFRRSEEIVAEIYALCTVTDRDPPRFDERQ